MIPETWVSVDPGDSTGVARWEGTALDIAVTLDQWPLITWLTQELQNGLELVVCEDWALYPYKLQQLAWDRCNTARLIGMIQLLCLQYEARFVLQPASIKKQAVAGGADALFYHPLYDNRHQNDAIMHGVYYLATNQAQAQPQPRPEQGVANGPPSTD